MAYAKRLRYLTIKAICIRVILRKYLFRGTNFYEINADGKDAGERQTRTEQSQEK